MTEKTPDGDINAWNNVAKTNESVTQTTGETAGIIDKIVKDGSVDVRDIPDLEAFLIELRDKGLIGLPNYNNGTMYYVPKDSIQSYKAVSRISWIRMGSDDEVHKWTENFADALWSMVTQTLSEVYVLDGEEYVRTDRNNKTFAILEKNSQCIKISGLKPAQLEVRRVLYFQKDDGSLVALNLTEDDGLPCDLSNHFLWF